MLAPGLLPSGLVLSASSILAKSPKLCIFSLLLKNPAWGPLVTVLASVLAGADAGLASGLAYVLASGLVVVVSVAAGLVGCVFNSTPNSTLP